jgi:SAM-dependent methyltransferase
MLRQARQNIGEADIPIRKVNYCDLPENKNEPFDAVVCLSNSINEPLEDVETLRALRSMKVVLRMGGILVFDFIHAEDVCEFKHFSIRIRTRLLDSWTQILRDAGFDNVEYFGDWDSAPYDKESSYRLIVVAKR